MTFDVVVAFFLARTAFVAFFFAGTVIEAFFVVAVFFGVRGFFDRVFGGAGIVGDSYGVELVKSMYLS